MELNFPYRQGSGLEKRLNNWPKDLLELLKQMLAYDPEDRISAYQALRHDFFKELLEKD